MSLVATWIPREVEVRVLIGDGRHAHLGSYLVRPATVREGISVMEVYELAAAGDEDAWSVIRRVVLGWLPLRLASQLVSRRFQRVNTVRIVVGLLAVGIESRERYEEDRRAAEERAAREGWDQVVLEYRHLANGDLGEPWPFFLRQAADLDQLRARAELSFLRAYSSARSPDPAGRNGIFRRAGAAENWEKMSRDEKLKRGQEGLSRIASIYAQQNAKARA